MIQRLQSLWLAGVLGLALLAAQSAMADVWYVDQAAAPGGNGTSWALAFQTIQPAIDAAAAAGGGEVWVTAGTQVEPEPASLSGALLVREKVAVLGGFSGDETHPDQRVTAARTTIRVKDQDVALWVMELESNTRLERLELTSGQVCGISATNVESILVEQVYFIEPDYPLPGNSLRYAVNWSGVANAELRSCQFNTNQQFSSGKFYFCESLNIIGCRITKCKGGFEVEICHRVIFQNCVFEQNRIVDYGLPLIALYGEGSAFKQYNEDIQILRCSFLHNEDVSTTPGTLCVGIRDTIRCRIEQCVFMENVSSAWGVTCIASFWGDDGHVPMDDCFGYAPYITDSLFLRNRSLGYGSAIYAERDYVLEKKMGGITRSIKSDSSPCFLDDRMYFPTFIERCSFIQNEALSDGIPQKGLLNTYFPGSVVTGGAGSPPVYGCIFWENTVPAVSGGPVSSYFPWSRVSNSRVQEEHSSPDNFFDDPKFVSPETDDYRLAWGSPCIDRIASAGGYDLDGNLRSVDGNRDGMVKSDVGAYEYQLPFNADQNSNGQVEISEILRVIQFYNAGGLHCADTPGSTEDGYVSGAGVNKTCSPHSSDYAPHNWRISLQELLRLIQFYNIGGYTLCEVGEDGFCPGVA